MMKYSDFNLSPEVLQAVEKMGFTEMTEIQEKAIPLMLEGRELIAKAPTGTGKTCAFGIPIVEKIDPAVPFPQAVILCPTRELSTQICEELRSLAQFKPEIKITAIYGGRPMQPQVAALKRGAQVVVATPGRLLDHMSHRTIRLDKVKIAVLDEADEMLDMGFFKDVRKILDRLPKQNQMVMFSATISREVMDIGWLYQRDAEEIIVRPVKDNEPKIVQYSLKSVGSQKLPDLLELLRQRDYKKAIVFCNTKHTTVHLQEEFARRGFSAQCLNGDLNQSMRNKIMADFRAGKIDILIATDVAARGIDVSDIDVVINYDVPLDNEYYLHRIGRTGRAKKEGTSYIFFSDDERTRLNNMLKYTRSSVIPLAFDEVRNLVEVESN